MHPVKIGIQLASLRQPFKKALLTAGRLGADAVEIDGRSHLNVQEMTRTGVRQIRKILDDTGLRVCALAFPTRRGYNDADELDRRVAATRDAIKVAYELGASVVINQIGHIPDDESDSSWAVLVEVLNDLGRHGNRVGATLAAQTGLESGERLARLIEALEPGALGVNLNPGALVAHGHSPLRAIQKLGSHIVHVHARDGVRDASQGRGLEVALGRGTADFPAVMGALEERNYRGYFTIERHASDDPEFEVGQAIKFLRSL